LLAANIRFFVLGSEKDLNDPTTRLYLSMSAAIGTYHAKNQAKKSMDNRIERAERGIPSCGKKCYARTWSEKEGWKLDEKKQQKILEIAPRYVAGEPLPKLAKAYGMNHANLCKILREQCGDVWHFRLRDRKFTVKVPRLLPPDLEKKV